MKKWFRLEVDLDNKLKSSVPGFSIIDLGCACFLTSILHQMILIEIFDSRCKASAFKKFGNGEWEAPSPGCTF
jgi:uncharacterized UBP type Zn finger protein